MNQYKVTGHVDVNVTTIIEIKNDEEPTLGTAPDLVIAAT